MDLAILGILFLVILAMLKFKRPLWQAVGAACIAGFVLYRFAPGHAATLAFKAMTAMSTLEVLYVIYIITFLQLILEDRGMMRRSEEALSGLFNNRRINASVAPIFIGMMPGPSAVVVAAPIVDRACGDYLDNSEKALISSFFRHIPESSMPTYSGVLIACQLSGVNIASFMILMIPMIICFIAVPYFVYLRKVPKDTGLPPSKDRMADFKKLVGSLWSIFLIIILVIIMQQLARSFPVINTWPIKVTTVNFIGTAVLVMFILVQKVKWSELKPIFPRAFHRQMMFSTLSIMVFRDLITTTGVIQTLPAVFAKLPIPEFLVFGIIVFLGAIISSQLAILTIMLPIIFAPGTGAGVPMLVLLMTFGHAAMQVAPTHLCLTLAAEKFGINLEQLLIKTLPLSLTMCALGVSYYLILSLVF